MLTTLLVTKVLPYVSTPWLVELLVGGAVKAVVGEKIKSLLKTRAAKKAFAAALRRSFARFAQEFPNVSSSFFDEQFLRNTITNELRRFLTRDEWPDPIKIAQAYEEQFPNSRGVANLQLIETSARFIALIEEECKKETDLTELLNSRQTDESVQILRRLDRVSRIEVAPLPPITAESVASAFRAASQELLAWPQTLNGNRWLERPELAQILQRIETTSSSVSLLLGEPGAGKSALLSRLAQEASRKDFNVLAIKADQLPEDISSLEALATYCELPGPPLDCIEAVTTNGAVVILIDQLDALSELIDLRTNRLTVLLRLINAAKDLANVHLVASCRTFERSYDKRLNSLDAEEIQLSLPSWTAIEPILSERGFSPEWPDSFKAILRVPQCLNLFLRHFAGLEESRIFKSYQEMLEDLWNVRLFAGAEHRNASNLAYEIATEMADRETLTMPAARFDDRRGDLEYLISAGILQYDTTNARVTFTHQTIFDFVRARAFVAQEQSLSRYVIERQTGLFVRPKLWSALIYLRNADPTAYRRELELLWNTEGLRAHIRMLLIDFLGLQERPLDFEIAILRRVFVDPGQSANAFAAIAGRQAWFEAIVSDILPEAMRRSRDEAWPVVNILSQAWVFARQHVMAMIRSDWLPDAAKHVHAWQALRGLQQWDEEAIAIAIAIIGTTPTDNYAVQDLASVASVSAPNLAPQLIGAQLRKQVAKALDSCAAGPAELDDPTVADELSELARDNPMKGILEDRTGWYENSAIADAAPTAYLTYVWPPIRDAFEALALRHVPREGNYRSDSSLATVFDLENGEQRNYEFPLVDSLVSAVRACANVDRQGFKEFAEENSQSELMATHRLIALGMSELAKTDPKYVINYLLADRRRLSLGDFRESERETKYVIRALVPHLTADDRKLLEDSILQSDPFKEVMADKDANDRRKYHKWRRQYRLRLLGAFPAGLLSPRAEELVESEMRAFPAFKDEPHEVTVWSAHSAMSAEKMAEASNATIASFLSAYPDATEWGDAFKRDGGSIEASRAFAAFAKTHTERAIAIARGLDPKTHQRPAAYAIRELSKDEIAAKDLYSLILELDKKGFANIEFRDCASAALRKTLEGHGVGLPDPIIEVLERWLDEYEVDTALDEPQTDPTEKEDGRDESLLWGLGGAYTVPSGSYPILEVYFFGLITRDTVPCERLLSTLEKQLIRKDRFQVWNALAHSALRRLSRCDRPSAQTFLDRVLKAYPALLTHKSGWMLIAHCLRWVSSGVTQHWIELVRDAGAKRSLQAYGELLVLRSVILGSDKWSRHQIDRILNQAASASAETETLCGLMYAAANLWKDARDRQLLARILTIGMDTIDEHVAKAAIDWFRLMDDITLDAATRGLLETFARGRSIEMAGSQSYAIDRLSDLVDTAPDLICEIARRIIEIHKAHIGNFATSAALDSETLISIALTLQRHPEPNRSRGLELFESLLHYNAYRVRDVLMDIDRRPGVSVPVTQLRRRRRTRQRGG